MNRLLLENNLSYLIVVDCVYNEKKYAYLINEKDTTDIKIVELVDDSKVVVVDEPELIKNIINEMIFIVDTYFE